MTHCREIGEMKPCPDNALSCMVEIRKRDGDLESVSLSIQSNCELHSLWISFFDKALKSERLTGGF